jgi:hypothetical protein
VAHQYRRVGRPSNAVALRSDPAQLHIGIARASWRPPSIKARAADPTLTASRRGCCSQPNEGLLDLLVTHAIADGGFGAERESLGMLFQVSLARHPRPRCESLRSSDVHVRRARMRI